MAVLLPEDLAPFADIDRGKAEAMIADAEAMAALAAPCITDPAFLEDQRLRDALVAILRRAILRWNEAGTGALTQQGAGPFQQTIDTRTPSRGAFWPSEIEQLRSLCAAFAGESGGREAFSVRPSRGDGGAHSRICALVFGARHCSCGSDLNRERGPLYEGGLFW